MRSLAAPASAKKRSNSPSTPPGGNGMVDHQTTRRASTPARRPVPAAPSRRRNQKNIGRNIHKTTGKTKGDPLIEWIAWKEKIRQMAEGVQSNFAAHPLGPRRWFTNRPANILPVSSTEHLKRRVIGLSENKLTLPLRDSAGLVHLNVTGLPPLCAAHPGRWRTLTETYSIVPNNIYRDAAPCQLRKSTVCNPNYGVPRGALFNRPNVSYTSPPQAFRDLQ